jgi:hypothetical protein
MFQRAVSILVLRLTPNNNSSLEICELAEVNKLVLRTLKEGRCVCKVAICCQCSCTGLQCFDFCELGFDKGATRT